MTTATLQNGIDAQKAISHWEQICQKLQSLAEEIPESAWAFRPTESTKTCAEVLRHVAFWNHYLADSARGKKADGTANEVSPNQFAGKAQILEELKRSSAGAAHALQQSSSGWKPEIAETLLSTIEHNCEHYGQLVVYARMNKIVPPASKA